MFYGKFTSFFNVKEVLKVNFEISDRLLLKLKRNNKIFLNGNICRIDERVNVGDKISVLIDFEEDNSNIVPTKMNLDIIYEDDAYIVINKPSGIPVHPSMLHYENSLSNGLKYYFDSIRLKKKIRPVNRLDKDTSGIVIFAKNEYVQEALIKQMKSKTFKKEYFAICDGSFSSDLYSGTINAPIARKENSIIERCVNPLGDSAITNYKVIQELNSPTSLSVLDINLITGRTHQIRVHTSYLGHPIIGDSLYGNASPFISRQALHAYKIEFLNPITNKKMVINSELPNDMKQILNYKR